MNQETLSKVKEVFVSPLSLEMFNYLHYKWESDDQFKFSPKGPLDESSLISGDLILEDEEEVNTIRLVWRQTLKFKESKAHHPKMPSFISLKKTMKNLKISKKKDDITKDIRYKALVLGAQGIILVNRFGDEFVGVPVFKEKPLDASSNEKEGLEVEVVKMPDKCPYGKDINGSKKTFRCNWAGKKVKVLKKGNSKICSLRYDYNCPLTKKH